MVVAAGDSAWRSLCARAAPLPLPSTAKWLVLAPHPDDETLGTGGLLAALSDNGIPAIVVYLTSGEASHQGAPQWSTERIGRTRRAEASRALHKLNCEERPPLFLGWQDGRPPPEGSAAFRRAVANLLALCRNHDIRNVATTWRGEAHCDHRAAYELGRALLRQQAGGLKLFEYLVWGWTDRRLPEKLRDLHVQGVDSIGAAERCRKAIACHRTQVSTLIRGARQAFRLAPEMIALASRSPLILLSEGAGRAA